MNVRWTHTNSWTRANWGEILLFFRFSLLIRRINYWSWNESNARDNMVKKTTKNKPRWNLRNPNESWTRMNLRTWITFFKTTVVSSIPCFDNQDWPLMIRLNTIYDLVKEFKKNWINSLKYRNNLKLFPVGKKSEFFCASTSIDSEIAVYFGSPQLVLFLLYLRC